MLLARAVQEVEKGYETMADFLLFCGGLIAAVLLCWLIIYSFTYMASSGWAAGRYNFYQRKFKKEGNNVEEKKDAL